ncbi:DUF1740-domain-containing protein [Xylaria sp. CBS 124048]|nr:DUF1740-domain-containing protein [Xylaria sp. CBS 124048]
MSSSHEKGKKPTVPKFASFKPKASDIADTTIGEPRHRLTAEIELPSQPASRPSPNPPAQQPSPRGSDRNALYYLDKKGDPLIRRYGGSDPRRIPEYRRIGAGRVLGCDGFIKVEKLGSRQEFFIRSYSEAASLLSSDKKTLRIRGFHSDENSIRIQPRTSGTDVTRGDFISLSTSRKRKRDENTSVESSDDEGPSYRSIHGASKKDEYSDAEQCDSDSSEKAVNGSTSNPMVIRSIELSKKVREHPEDVESWLELADHQDTLLHAHSGSRAPTAAEVKSFADIKLSLLEQAVTHASDDGLRERLNLKVITEGAKVWGFATAQKKFSESMQRYPKNFELWKCYISFLQSTLSACRYDEIKRLYTDKLQYLGRELLTLPSVPEKVQCSEQIIYVFLRLTHFLADAGFHELASAAWQASLELNLARAPTLPQTGWEIPSSFQEFWESEVPRLGEDDWRGWAAFITDPSGQEPPNPKTPKPPVMPTTRDGYKAWHAIEYCMAQNSTIPARTLDEGAEDDPFRVVMFSDLQDMLLYFPTDIIPHIRPQFLDSFLTFCNLPPSLHHGDFSRTAVKDPFLARSPQGVLFSNHPSGNNTDGGAENRQTRLPEFSNEMQQICPTPDVLFPSNEWFRYLEQIRDKVPSCHYRWVAATLEQLTRVVGTEQLGPYSLAFDSINGPGKEKKIAKALLKNDPLNVDLYLGYSILEGERGNKAAARNVLAAALGLPSISAHDRLRLGIAAVWLELVEGELAKAVAQLCWLAEDVPNSDNRRTEATPSQVLKARQFLATNRDYKISSGDVAHAVIYGEGLVLLDYLTQRSEKEPSAHKQGDIWSAILSITRCSEDLVSHGQQHSPAHEKFLQFAARLLYYHASHGSFRPGLLRGQLAQYLSYFPSNTIFLSLFAWRQERLSINDRVRSLLQDHVLTRHNESLSSHVFAISYELRTGNAHSARAAFERALSSEVCAHHVELWIAYIRFCHSRKELRVKAKAVFYRAIQACPWSKEVFMEAFGTLVREVDSAELKNVYSTMCEKGLRVHVDMDEFVEKWRREQKGVEKQKKGNTSKAR